MKSPPDRPRPPRELVLVGAGHAHVQVLRRWMMRPVPDVRLSLVLDQPEAFYSGMVTGLVAGEYEPHELIIDAVPLARRAGANVILSAATLVDPRERRIDLEGRPPIFYDVASLDVGSSVHGLDLPGVREHALTTRPLGGLLADLESRLEALHAAALNPARVVVVGGGAAGVELAFCTHTRLAARGLAVELLLVCDSEAVLPGRAPGVVVRVRQELERSGIAVVPNAQIEAIDKDAVVLARGGGRLKADLVIWATGAAAPDLVRLSPVPSDEGGYVLVDETLEVAGFKGLFAAGDCASITGHDWVPKAGVYAVRAGPVLDANLRAALEGRSLKKFKPQRDFLSLLTLGGGRAFGAKWGFATAGPSVWRLKDWIDRRFMRRFQVLDADGAQAAGFPSPESMGMEPMECGGCAAKVEASALSRALGRLDEPLEDPSVVLGLAQPDDAAAFETARGDVVLATVDAFRAFTDDAWLVGRVAAINAVSDVLAKGGRPRHALAAVTVPAFDGPKAEEMLFQVLSGIRAALDPLGITLVGGHSTAGPELFVGLTVTGDLGGAESWLPLDGAEPGDRLVLSKPLGAGVLLAADMRGLAKGRWVEALHASLVRANAESARIAREFGARACTDVSGFGLAGHLIEMLRASNASARVRMSALPRLDGTTLLLRSGVRSTFHAQNASNFGSVVEGARGDEADLLFDPQTSGGLLMAVAAGSVSALVEALHAAGDASAADIGEVTVQSGSGPVIRVDDGA